MRKHVAVGILTIVGLATACNDGVSTTAALTANAPPTAAVSTTIFTHCGFWEIDFDGRRWSPISIARGSMPLGTHSLATPGTLTVFTDDLLLFAADSGLVVEFGPAPPDLPPIPPCD